MSPVSIFSTLQQQNSQWMQTWNLLSEKTQFTDGKIPSVAESLLYLQQFEIETIFTKRLALVFHGEILEPGTILLTVLILFNIA